ncbi:MAG: DEAD/DEAH box helicase [Candidatus Izemoplasmatales bacterium]|nr:DEAD/DEAH box helicase [Candidatus Izemoplasmatales bacterium]
MKCLVRNDGEGIEAVTRVACRRCGAQADRLIENRYGQWECRDCRATRADTMVFTNRAVLPVLHELRLPFTLSMAQQKGSDFFLDCLKHKRNAMMLAVCGAGKTEMTFQTILYALNQGLKIAFVIPRTQVVIEIAKRLKFHFPKTRIEALHAESKADAGAHLLVSTPQQMIRYVEEFDLMILDEADAFPYQNDAYLQRLVQRAIKRDGMLFQMSATLTPQTHSDAFMVQPQRFHGYPLDLPRIIHVPYLASTLRQQRLPRQIRLQFDQWRDGCRQALVFVPSIPVGEQLVSIMKRQGYNCMGFSSHSPHKDVTLRKLRDRTIDFLVTTTIMERGMTFPGIQVAIIHADHPIFTDQVLMQISGRVGRHQDDPSGDIILFSEHQTVAMSKLRKTIIRFNMYSVRT